MFYFYFFLWILVGFVSCLILSFSQSGGRKIHIDIEDGVDITVYLILIICAPITFLIAIIQLITYVTSKYFLAKPFRWGWGNLGEERLKIDERSRELELTEIEKLIN